MPGPGKNVIIGIFMYWEHAVKRYADLSEKDASGSGQALVLLCLVVSLFADNRGWAAAALVFLVLNMAYPRLFKLFALLWLNLSHLLGAIVSRIVLTLEFFLLVLPVGLLLRVFNHDAMMFKKWRRGSESVFSVREHTYVADDLRNPY